MLMRVYSVFDKVTQVYGPLLLEVNDLSLKRNCKTMIMQELQSGNKSLEGFVARRGDLFVYNKGTFDTSTGELLSLGEVQVFTVSELVEEVQSELSSKILRKECTKND